MIKHTCPRCGQLTYGSVSEGGLTWALCQECMDADRERGSARAPVSEYPDDWDAITEGIKAAVGWRCEHCSHPHDPASGHTLTVHHLDGDGSNNTVGNLVALCQRCHLHIQAHFVPGQLVLPGWRRPFWMVERDLGV